MPTASYFFNVLSYTKDLDQFTQGEIDKDYTPYVINRMISGYRNLCIFADELNIRPNIAKEDQMFLYSALIPKKKRRVVWPKKTKNDNLDIIMQYYNVSAEKAQVYLSLLSQDQIQELSARLNKGGRE